MDKPKRLRDLPPAEFKVYVMLSRLQDPIEATCNQLAELVGCGTGRNLQRILGALVRLGWISRETAIDPHAGHGNWTTGIKIKCLVRI